MIRQSLSSNASVKRRETISSELIRNRISSWTRPELVTPPPTNWFAKSTYKSRVITKKRVLNTMPLRYPINDTFYKTGTTQTSSLLCQNELPKGAAATESVQVHATKTDWMMLVISFAACVPSDLWADPWVNSIHLASVLTWLWFQRKDTFYHSGPDWQLIPVRKQSRWT